MMRQATPVDGTLHSERALTQHSTSVGRGDAARRGWYFWAYCVPAVKRLQGAVRLAFGRYRQGRPRSIQRVIASEILD